MEIVKNNDMVSLNELLENKNYKKSNDIFIYSCMLGNYEMFEYLLKDKNTIPDSKDSMAIILACRYNNYEIVKKLLDDGRVDPTAQDNECIVSTNDIRIIKLLLKNKNINPSAQDNSVLIGAIDNESLDIIKILLKDKRVDPSYPDNEPFISACKMGNLEIVKLLLEDKRIDPSFQNNEALIAGLYFDKIEVIKLLSNVKKINLSIPDNIILKYVVEKEEYDIIEKILNSENLIYDTFFYQIFILLCMKGNLKMVKLFLNSKNINPSEMENEPIKRAIVNNNTDIIKILLDDERFIFDHSIEETMLIAIENNNIEAVNIMLDNKKFKPNISSLFSAIKNNKNDIAKILLKNKKIDPSDDDSASLLYAINDKNLEMVKLLLEDGRVNAGANNNICIKYTVKNNELDNVKLLLKNKDVDPSVDDNICMKSAIKNKNIDIIKLLINDKRISVYEIERLIPDEYSEILKKRMKKDEKIRNNILNVLHDTLKMKQNMYNLHRIKINYFFSCLNEEEFLLVLKSDFTNDELIYFFSHIKNIRFEIKYRDPLIILKEALDKKYVVDMILNNFDFIELINVKDIPDELLLKIYEKYTISSIVLKRDKKLGDIIPSYNKKELFKYILNGNYLPYENHEFSKNWFQTNEKKFLEEYRFPINYHKEYIDKFTKAEIHVFNYYIYKDYYSLNMKMREKKPLVNQELDIYNIATNKIINAPTINKKCILYRGIKINNFNYNIGDIIEWNGFNSCSSIKEISDKFKGKSNCCMFIIIVPKGSVLLDITTLKKSEFEILIPPFALLKFLGIINSNIILKYIGYKTDIGVYRFSQNENNLSLEQEIDMIDN